ncbi:MAG TPA: transcriptional regulator [Chloroflexi bacterium]|nr:transcriptional regulator [Chloroflexota bacterium]
MSTNAQALLDLIASGMSATLHWYPEDVAISQLAATLVGMANAQGGSLLLGVSPRAGHILGVSDPVEEIDRIFQAALLSDPPLVLPVPQVVVVDGSTLIRVSVPAGLPHVYSLEGRYLERSGRRETPLSARNLRALLVARGVIQFEARLAPHATLDDLDFEQVRAYLAALSLPDQADPAIVLQRRGCLTAENGELRPTYAALLLFGKHPQQWLPNAAVLAARFPGMAISDEFVKQEIRGTLPDQLRQAETFVRDHLRSVARLVGLTRQETPEYPLEAVRELLVNAIAHRDYSQQGDTIHLHIFADRLEVHSPGGLPGPVTLDNLLEARFSRNAVIAQVLSDLGFVERLGYGLNRVVTVMKRNNLPRPRFEEIGGSFRVTLFGAETELTTSASLPDLARYEAFDLNPRQARALGFLINKARITNSDYQGLCPEVSAETLRRDLADLVKKGILIKVGSKRATYYILKR